MKKRILFVTSTRADYGKIKSIILRIQNDKKFVSKVFVTGMHNMKIYGSTVGELIYEGENVFMGYAKNTKDLSLPDTKDGILKDNIDVLIKRIAVLEKRIEHLESKFASKKSTSSRDEKWSEFRSVIRLQEKNTSKLLS